VQFFTNRFKKPFILSILWLFFSTWGQAQSSFGDLGMPFIRNYSLKEYSTKVYSHSYPKNGAQNFSICQDDKGLLYFANQSGVLQYDGEAWLVIPTKRKTGVISLAIDNQQRVFVGAESEIGYLEPDATCKLVYVSLLDYLSPEERKFSSVWQTFSTSHGVFFSTRERLFRWDGERFTTWSSGDNIFHVAFAVNDKIYIRQKGIGLVTLNGDKLELVPNGAMFANDRIDVMLPYEGNTILVASQKKGLMLYDGQQFTAFASEVNDFIKESYTYHGAKLKGGLFAISTLHNGVVIIDKKGVVKHHLNRKAGLAEDAVFFAYQDMRNDLWLATDNGITKVELSVPLTHYTEANGLIGTVDCILRHDNQLYITTTYGLFRLNPAKGLARARFERVGNIKSQCWQMLSTENGLLVTAEDGTKLVNGNTVKVVSPYNSRSILRSEKDSKLVYLGLSDGLSTLIQTGTTWADGGRIQGTKEEIRTMQEDEQGRLWLGTFYSNSVYTLIQESGQLPRVVTHANVLQDSTEQSFINIYKINNKIVFATREGILTYDEANKAFIPHPAFSNKPSDNTTALYLVMEDQQKNVWIFLNQEMHRATLQSDGTYKVERVDVYKKMPPSLLGFADGEQAIWVGGYEGLQRYDLKEKYQSAKPFFAMIRQAKTSNDSLLFAGVMSEKAGLSVLPYSHNAMRFAFAAPAFNSEGINHYSFKLENIDKDWSDWSTESRKDYTNLPEGKYTFKVKSRDGFGHVSEEASYEFRIKSPWYRTYWAYGLYVLLGVGSLFGFNAVRTSKLQYDKGRLEQAILQRTTQISLQKEEIEAQRDEIEEQNKLLQKRNDDITSSIEYARMIQNALFPLEEDVKKMFDEAFILFKPRDIVSGDFYWMSKKNGIYLLAVADCTGHGVPGAFMSMIGNAFLNEIVNDKGITDTAEVLNQLSKAVKKAFRHHERQSTHMRDGMDIALCAYNPQTRELQFSGGKRPLLIVQDGIISTVKGNNFSIGGQSRAINESFTTNTIKLDTPAMVYMFSDGYIDQYGGPVNKKFMSVRLRELLQSIAHLPAEDQKKMLEDVLSFWQGEQKQIDDILLMGFRV
jgi:serine phosphatase RsbU (regulator of sigma subunit)/ligand-binding sensor domain-containing protein